MKSSRLAVSAVVLGAAMLLAPTAWGSVDPCCYDDGKCVNERTDVCYATGGYKPGAISCSPNPCPQPEGGSCATAEMCQEGLQCIDGTCLGMKMAPAASNTGLALLVGGLILVGGFAASRKLELR